MKHGNQRGVALITEIILAAAVLVVVAVAGYVALHAKPAGAPASSLGARATPDTGPTASWTSHQSKAEPKLSFKYPPGWSAKIVGSDDLQLTSPAGSVVLWQSAVASVGGSCDASKPKFIRSVAKIGGGAGLYLVEIGSSAGATDHIGVLGNDSGQAPKVGPTDCAAYTIFRSRTRVIGGSPITMALQTTGSIAPADIAEIRLLLGSLTY